MGKRQDLHNILMNDVLQTEDCYFVKPARKMNYPAIVYELVGDSPTYGDNKKYYNCRRYLVNVITRDPDSDIPQRLSDRLEYCSLDRVYVSDNLHHFAFTVFF